MTQHSAWQRDRDTTFGAGKYPFGLCQGRGCDRAACHRVPGGGLVCQRHLPKEILFAPFLGQQEKLFATNARWVLGGGGAGGSKTFAGARLWLKQYMKEQERWKNGQIEQSKGFFLFLRRTYPELLQQIEQFKAYKDKIGPNRWDSQTKLCTFENGFKVRFGGMENDDDWLKYYGDEYTMVVGDEATQFTVKQITELDSRIRCSDPVLDRMCQMYLLTNPIGGETKQYLKRRFVTVAKPETEVDVTVTLTDGRKITEKQVYIPCNLYDNPALMETGRYEANLRLKGSGMQRALLMNDWDVDEGAWVGDDWDPSVHVCKPFKIPKTWTLSKSGDYGYGISRRGHRSSILWFAKDPEGNVVCYRSWTARGMTVYEMAQRIKEIEKRPLLWVDPETKKSIVITSGEWDESRECSNVYGPMDAALWGDHQESGETRGEILDREGCGFYRSAKGTRQRHHAAEVIRNMLRTRHIDGGGVITPGLRFFATCRTVLMSHDNTPEESGPIASIPGVPIDDKDPDVWDTKADDDDLDALAYYAASNSPPGDKLEDHFDTKVLKFVRKDSEETARKKIGW